MLPPLSKQQIASLLRACALELASLSGSLQTSGLILTSTSCSLDRAASVAARAHSPRLALLDVADVARSACDALAGCLASRAPLSAPPVSPATVSRLEAVFHRLQQLRSHASIQAYAALDPDSLT